MKLNFPPFDYNSGGLAPLPKSPVSELSAFQGNESTFSECPFWGYPVGDCVGTDECYSRWNSTSPVLIYQKESHYSQRTNFQAIKRKLFDLPKLEPLVTKENHFIFKEELSWNHTEELPDVILESPRKENTPEPDISTISENDLISDFENAKLSLDAEFCDGLLSELSKHESIQYFDQDLSNVQTKNTNELAEFINEMFRDSTNHQSTQYFNQNLLNVSSFNEISCSINQQGSDPDSQSTIKQLLILDSCDGNGNMKKSTEISSEIHQSYDYLAEHNYFSRSTSNSTSECTVSSASSASAFAPAFTIEDLAVQREKSCSPSQFLEPNPSPIVSSQCSLSLSKPEVAAISETPNSTSECTVASVTSASPLVPIVTRNIVVKKEISNSSSDLLKSNLSPIVSSQCSLSLSKPDIAAISETPNSTSECTVASVTSASPLVPIVTRNIVVKKEISNSSSDLLKSNLPRIVLSRCSPKTSSGKSTKVGKKLDTTEKQKKAVPPKGRVSKALKNDPTYQPYAKKQPPKKVVSKALKKDPTYHPYAKKSAPKKVVSKALKKDPTYYPYAKKSAPKKVVSKALIDDPTYYPYAKKLPPKKVASKSVKKDPTYHPYAKQPPARKVVSKTDKPSKPDIAELPSIPIKSSSCKGKLSNRNCVVELQISPSVASEPPTLSSRFTDEVNRSHITHNTVAVPEADPVDTTSPRTSLASPAKDDLKDDDEFTNQDSSQPETLNTNVDMNIEPIQPVEDPMPKIKRKKVKLEAYKLRLSMEKSNQTEDSPAIEEGDLIVVPTPGPNIEEVLKTIIQPKSTPEPVVKSKASPAVQTLKSDHSRPKANTDPAIKTEVDRFITTNEHKPAKEPPNNTFLKLPKGTVRQRTSSVRSCSSSPDEVSQSFDLWGDRFASSGVSSYHNSSASSMNGSPLIHLENKSNDAKPSDNGTISANKSDNPKNEKTLPKLPFAVDKELLRGYIPRWRRHKRRRSDSRTHKRKASDSCFEEDSDSSDYSDRKRSRSRYISPSFSSSDKYYHSRSHSSRRSSLSQRYRESDERKYSERELVPIPYHITNYNSPVYYQCPALSATAWHPDFGALYQPLVPNMQVPRHFNGSHETPMNISEMEIDRRVLFVGNIEDDLSKKELNDRFKKFGHIYNVKIFPRANQTNYGFVYFTDEKSVQKAIECGKDDPKLSAYKLGLGIRKEHFADRRAFTCDRIPAPNYPSRDYREDSYNSKLEKFKHDLKIRKLDDR